MERDQTDPRRPVEGVDLDTGRQTALNGRHVHRPVQEHEVGPVLDHHGSLHRFGARHRRHVVHDAPATIVTITAASTVRADQPTVRTQFERTSPATTSTIRASSRSTTRRP